MEAGFAAQLDAALGRKKQHLEEKTLPRLRERLATYQGLFEGIHSILLRKGLIQEDPYRDEHRDTEITLPSTEAFLDTERADKMSQRLSEYHVQLELLNTSSPLGLEFLTLKRLKRIRELVGWISWSQLSDSAPDANTAGLSFLIGRVRLGSDSLSTGILSTAVNQLEPTAKGILELLAEVTRFQREQYKLELRRKVLSRLPPLDPATPEEALKTVRRQFAQFAPGETFFTDLVTETLMEEYFDPEGVRRAEALQGLAIPETKTERKKTAPAYREILLDGVRVLARTSRPLADALRKLLDNQQVVENRRRGLLGQVKRWLKRLGRRGEDRPVYEVRRVDPATSTSRLEPVDFQSFHQDVLRKIRLLEALNDPTAPAWKKLRFAPEKALQEFLTRNIGELQDIRLKMEGLGTLFRNEVRGADAERLKGTRIELTILKNHQMQANRKRHEYASLHEEQEQLKRLGMEGVQPGPG